MKKLILLLVCFAGLAVAAFSQVSAPKTYGAYLGVKDTLTNAQASSKTTTIPGNKTAITYQVEFLKLTGTVAGTIKLYISADGTNWPAAAADSLTLTDNSGVYQLRRTYNAGVAHRITVATTGTSTASERVYLFWRQ